MKSNKIVNSHLKRREVEWDFFIFFFTCIKFNNLFLQLRSIQALTNSFLRFQLTWVNYTQLKLSDQRNVIKVQCEAQLQIQKISSLPNRRWIQNNRARRWSKSETEKHLKFFLFNIKQNILKKLTLKGWIVQKLEFLKENLKLKSLRARDSLQQCR